MKRNIFILLLIVTCCSCTEEFDTSLSNSGRRLVVEGTITDQDGPYYIKLTWSLNQPPHHSVNVREDLFEPVKNATIVIYDDYQNIDTLIPSIEVEGYNYDPDRGYYYVYHNPVSNTYDTIFLSIMDYAPVYDRGFYKTTHFKAVPGRFYYLRIEVNNRIYTASDYMHFVPEIDSLSVIKRVCEKDGEEYFVPLLYFYEPQNETNYFLIQLVDELDSRVYSINRLWEFSILSDEFLQPYVNGIVIENGQSPDGLSFYYYSPGMTITVTLSSLSFGAYQYYYSLIEQFKNDGGGYSPAPSSPPTNISNGALGFFRGSATSTKQIIINP